MIRDGDSQDIWRGLVVGLAAMLFAF
jgi:hypothetical protein